MGVLAVTTLSIGAAVLTYLLVMRRDPGALSETWRRQGTRRFVPSEPPAGPDAEAMGVDDRGRILTDQELLEPLEQHGPAGTTP
jgi:hypothetical protein